MAGNFIAMVYAVLRDKGVSLKGLSTDEAIAKYEELIGKTGRYSTETGELEKDNKSNVSVPKASGFNRSNTKSHLSHAKEMGLNEKQYVKAAKDFFNGAQGKLYRSSNGKYYKYDEKHNLVCICNQNGTIHSFYQYKTKSAFQRVIGQEKLEEIK